MNKVQEKDSRAVNDRMQLIMDRLIARAILRDGTSVERAKARLLADHGNSEKTEWWVSEWMTVLSSSPLDVARFLYSRSDMARRLSSTSPFYMKGVVDLDFADLDLRKRLWLKAKMFGETASSENIHRKGL
jgi:hypothetical protein